MTDEKKIVSLQLKILSQENIINDTNNIMECKIISLQKHINNCEAKILNLENTNNSLHETLDVLTKKYSANWCFNETIGIANPKYAIKMLETYNIDAFMYSCKTLDSKQELIKEALNTNNDNIILIVCIFLQNSLDTINFDKVIMKNELTSSLLLNYLLKKDFLEFEFISLRYNKHKEYVKGKLQQCLADKDINNRKKELELLIDYTKKHDLIDLNNTIETCILNIKNTRKFEYI